MNKEKRIKLVEAMSIILDAVSDDEIFETFEGRIPTKEDLEDESELYISDERFAQVLDSFVRMTTKANEHDGYWCDGASSEETTRLDKGLGRTQLTILYAGKAPILENEIVSTGDTRWKISGYFGRMPFLANSYMVVRIDHVVNGDELFRYRGYGYPFTSAEERMLLRSLAKELKAGAVEGLTVEEAETMEKNWRMNDRKGEEW